MNDRSHPYSIKEKYCTVCGIPLTKDNTYQAETNVATYICRVHHIERTRDSYYRRKLRQLSKRNHWLLDKL